MHLEEKANTADFICCLQHLQVWHSLCKNALKHFLLLAIYVELWIMTTVHLFIEGILFSNPSWSYGYSLWYVFFEKKKKIE